MAAPLEKTRHPGIYRQGSKYVLRYRADGKRYAERRDTLKEALELQRSRLAARDRGELDRVNEGRVPFREYAAEWVERYQGNGKRGFTSDTRHEYRRDLERYAFPRFGDRKLSSITPRDIAEWIAWLCDSNAQGKRVAEARREAMAAKRGVSPLALPLEVEPVELSDATVRRIVVPVRSAFATARREGLVRSNPADDNPLPSRPQIEDGEDEASKALTRPELAMFLRVVPAKWRLMFEFLAATGLRWSELAALRWQDLQLDGSEPHVRVRRALAKRQPKGGEPRYKPPKSKYGRRSIPLDPNLARALRERQAGAEYKGPDELVFPAENGRPLRQENVRRRVLAVAAGEAGVPWIGFHTFRHTCASLLFAGDRNVKQVQRWLGHHSPGFTLDTYVHLLDEGVGGGLDLASELTRIESNLSPYPAGSSPSLPDALLTETVSESQEPDVLVSQRLPAEPS